MFVAVAPSANDGNDAEHNADSPATDQVLGYAFCVFQQHLNSNILTDIKTLYIDDLCVDERSRGHHVAPPCIATCSTSPVNPAATT